MSHLVKRIVVACMATGLAGLVSAQGYAGVGVGQSRVKLDCTGADTCDRTDTAWKLFGGYQFTPNLALEAAYHDQGTARLTASDAELGTVGADFKGEGFGLWGIATWPLQAFSVYAKLGVVSARLKIDARASAFGAASTSERHTQGAWGLGTAFEVAPRWVVRLDYERFRARLLDERFPVTLVTLGALHRF